MQQRMRIIAAIVLIVFVAGIVIVIDLVQRRQNTTPEPGSLPVIVDNKVQGYILPSQLASLDTFGFVDAEEGKQQEGWLLRDVLDLVINVNRLDPQSAITVSSSSRGKSVDVTWSEALDTENMVMFDLSNRGTLKLVSAKLANLDTRDEWVQDVDKIEVQR